MPHHSKLQRAILLHTVCITALLPLSGCNKASNIITGRSEKTQIVDGPRRVPQGNQEAVGMQTQTAAPVTPVAPQAAQLTPPPAPVAPMAPSRYAATPMVETVTTPPVAPADNQPGLFNRMFTPAPVSAAPVEPEVSAQPRTVAPISGTLPSPRILSGERKGFVMNPNNPNAGEPAIDAEDIAHEPEPVSRAALVSSTPVGEAAINPASPATAPATQEARESWFDRMVQKMKANGEAIEARNAGQNPQGTALNARASEEEDRQAEEPEVPQADADADIEPVPAQPVAQIQPMASIERNGSPVTSAPEAPKNDAVTQNESAGAEEPDFPSLSTVPEQPAKFAEMKADSPVEEQALRKSGQDSMMKRYAIMAEPSEFAENAPTTPQPAAEELLAQAAPQASVPAEAPVSPTAEQETIDVAGQPAGGPGIVTLVGNPALQTPATQLVPPVSNPTFNKASDETPAAEIPAAETAAGIGNEHSSNSNLQMQSPAPAVRVDAVPEPLKPEVVPAKAKEKPAVKPAPKKVKTKEKLKAETAAPVAEVTQEPIAEETSAQEPKIQPEETKIILPEPVVEETVTAPEASAPELPTAASELSRIIEGEEEAPVAVKKKRNLPSTSALRNSGAISPPPAPAGQ